MGKFLILIMSMIMFSASAENAIHGDTSMDKQGNVTVWSEGAQAWLDVESFWMEYVTSNGGLTWDRSSEYPEYSKVKERDTFIVELSQGPCLMEFFHERWRRANDVVRWNEKLNEVAGCPYVFD